MSENTVTDPPTEQTDRWKDYKVPVTAYGGLVVRARNADEAMDYVRENVYASDVDLELDVDDVNRDSVVRSEGKDHWDDPYNVKDEPPSTTAVSVPTVPSIGQLQSAREQLGLSQQYVADQLGVVRTTVSGWERDANEISLSRAKEYADLLARHRLLSDN